MPVMQPLKPCARCEQELPEAFFEGKHAAFCIHCTDAMTEMIRRKYSVIEAAHFRAQMRLSSKKLKTKMDHVNKRAVASVGD